jgi:cardiolipin synthase
MTLANKITLIRILLIPVFIILLLQQVPVWPAVIFTLTIFTYALDGFIARWRKQRSALGSFLDPLADKLLMFSTYVTLTYLKIIPLWIFIVILSRDVLIVLGWTIAYFITDSTEIHPRVMGKITTILQMTTAWLIVLGVTGSITQSLLIATVVATVLSGLDYIYNGSKKITRHTTPEK